MCLKTFVLFSVRSERNIQRRINVICSYIRIIIFLLLSVFDLSKYYDSRDILI